MVLVPPGRHAPGMAFAPGESRTGNPGRASAVLPATLALIASALLFYFGTGFAPVAGLAAVAPLPVLLLAPRVSARTTAGVAWVAFAAGTTNSWSLYRNSVDIPVPMAALIVAGMSLTFMLAVLLFRALLRRGRALLATLSAPALWVAVLYAVAVSNPAGIMGTLATAQADVPLVLQIASITGAWGVEYLVLVVPAALAALLSPGVTSTARLRTGVLTAVLVATTLGYGALRLADSGETGPRHRVALLAGNEKHQWGTEVTSPAGQQKIVGYRNQIAHIPGGADIVVLPEGGFAADAASLPRLVEPLARVARSRQVDIVVGLVMRTPGPWFNTALDIPADGSRPVAFHKWHDGGRKFRAGHDLAFLPGTGNRVGMAVCGDVNFQAPIRDYADAGTHLVAIPASNEDLNGWQHSRTALLRGVENGLGIAWSSQRGTLMAADPLGRVLASHHTGTALDVAVAEVPAGTGPTIYTRIGDLFAWLCIAMALGGLISMWVPKPRRAAEHRNVHTPEKAGNAS